MKPYRFILSFVLVLIGGMVVPCSRGDEEWEKVGMSKERYIEYQTGIQDEDEYEAVQQFGRACSLAAVSDHPGIYTVRLLTQSFPILVRSPQGRKRLKYEALMVKVSNVCQAELGDEDRGFLDGILALKDGGEAAEHGECGMEMEPESGEGEAADR
ncbi:MAG: hypothetical protein LBR62_01050 [Puniceicoccales bacterium]|jgi:hypothetical protein|nr:hypothetical protein [Puniceicoccales bacterium]